MEAVTDTDETQLLHVAADLHRKGWEVTLAPAGKKAPVVPGTTGDNHDRELSLADVQTWVMLPPHYGTIGVVCPRGVIGIDVDDYTNHSGVTKTGGEAMAAMKACAGPLPATWRTTSRNDTKSGIWFYRLPGGLQGTADEHWPTGLADVEFIRYSHRWAITAPSLHATTGNPYRWEGPNGSTDAPPTDDLPSLTAAHVAHLRGECGCNHRPRPSSPAAGVDAAFTTASTFTGIEDAVGHFWDAMHGNLEGGSRYDVMVAVLGRLVRDGALDETLHAELREIYVEAVWKDRAGGRKAAEDEYNRAGLGAVAKGFAKEQHPATPVERSIAAQHEAPQTEGRKLLTLHTLEDLANLPPPQWHVENLVPEGGLTILFGPPGSYKSFLALSLALALDTGSDFIGHPVADTCRPLYVAGEGHSGMGVRAQAWHAHHDRNRIDSRTLVQNGAINLADYDHIAQLCDAIEEHDVGFVIFDTLARCTLGVEENSASEMGVVIANIDTIRHRTGAGVLVVHHSGKDPAAGSRGSSAIKGAADAELSTIGGRLRVEKMKDGPEIDPTPFHMVTPDEFIGSVVPVATSTIRYEPEPDDEPTFGEDLAAIVEWLESEGEPRALRSIHREVAGRNERLTATVSLAVDRGYLIDYPGPRGAKMIGLPEWDS